MPNMQVPIPTGLTPKQTVACAIHCCDNAPYDMKRNRAKRVTCQRLAHRKHSCVLHSLREKPGGKLSTSNRFPNVWASPRSPGKIGGKIRIPDTVVGNEIIDAKFPCDPEKVYPHLPMSGQVMPSDPAAGLSMMTPKEKTIYKKFPHPVTNTPIGDNVSCMTPSEATTEIQGTTCTCT